MRKSWRRLLWLWRQEPDRRRNFGERARREAEADAENDRRKRQEVGSREDLKLPPIVF